MGYQSKILGCIDQLEAMGPASADVKQGYEDLRKQVREINDERTLFMMLQSLRETIASVSGDKLDTSFEIKLPDGSTTKVKNLDEASQKIKEHGYKATKEAYNYKAGRLRRNL